MYLLLSFKILFMKLVTLLPSYLKHVGWLLFVLGVLLGIYYIMIDSEPEALNTKMFAITSQPLMEQAIYFDIVRQNILDEIIGLLLIIGMIFIAFAAEKHEDEYIMKLRLDALVWATYINYAILCFTLLLIYELTFFMVLVFNMFTLLIIFIIRFKWLLMQNKMDDEELH